MKFIVAAFVLAICCISCGRSVPINAHSEEDFMQIVGQFPYTAPAERKNKILVNYSALRTGMRMDEVEKLIGEADFGQHARSGIFATPNGVFWIYYLHKHYRIGVNPKEDQVLELLFDTQGKVVFAVPSNVEGLEPIGKSPV